MDGGIRRDTRDRNRLRLTVDSPVRTEHRHGRCSDGDAHIGHTGIQSSSGTRRPGPVQGVAIKAIGLVAQRSGAARLGTAASASQAGAGIVERDINHKVRHPVVIEWHGETELDPAVRAHRRTGLVADGPPARFPVVTALCGIRGKRSVLEADREVAQRLAGYCTHIEGQRRDATRPAHLSSQVDHLRPGIVRGGGQRVLPRGRSRANGDLGGVGRGRPWRKQSNAKQQKGKADPVSHHRILVEESDGQSPADTPEFTIAPPARWDKSGRCAPASLRRGPGRQSPAPTE